MNVRQRQFTGVAGTRPIVVRTVNRLTGPENTRNSANEPQEKDKSQSMIQSSGSSSIQKVFPNAAFFVVLLSTLHLMFQK